ncbi:MAG: hypothetical protein CMI53_00535 [Parcubacteria group bacterium]|nr:hypothetical protein [Parcubacteria group bacterium]|tara:strand:- start:944 stop:2785 length:1842 start_codon:yes stop_codon:yes gene_type:complete
MKKPFTNFIKLNSKFVVVIMLLTAFSTSSVGAETLVTDEELATDTVDQSGDIGSTDTLEFTLEARWGFVQGNSEDDKTEKDYSGYIKTNNTAVAKIRLNNTALFENNDSIQSKENPVSWSSTIFGHWDGVSVNVRAKADANITVKIPRGDITKTAREWYRLTEKEILKIGGDQMLVVKSHPKKRRRHAVFIWWGRTKNITGEDLNSCEDHTYSSCPLQCGRICLQSCNEDSTICTADCEGAGSCFRPNTDGVNFSGTLKTDSDINIKLKKTMRFEDNDEIVSHDRNQISWTSQITTGRDGLYTLMLPHSNVALNSNFSVNFTNIFEDDNWFKRFTLADVKNGVRETIKVNDVDYVLVIGYKTIANKLVRSKRSGEHFLIKNNIRHSADDTDILTANGYAEEEAEVIDDDELESYELGDDLSYPDGTVVEAGNKTYVISNGVKRLLANNRAKDGIPWARQITKQLKLGKLEAITSGPAVESEDEITDNTLVKVDGDSAVWRIRGGKRQVFNHVRIFNLHRLDIAKVKTITPEKLQKFTWSPPVEFPDGSLVKIPTDPKVYLLKNGIRHWIETEGDLKGLGHKFSDIVDMSPTEIVNYPAGDPVISDEVTVVTEF